MNVQLIVLLPLLAACALLLFQTLRRVTCPDCGAMLPPLMSPLDKSRRMWRVGGYRCARCRCETDRDGRKVTADTPPASFPTCQTAVVIVLLLIGLGLGGTGLLLPRRAAAPLVPSARPVVAAPQTAALPQAPGG